jgi:plastocyanin
VNTKRFFLVAALLVVAALALAACGGGGSAGSEPLNITIKGQDIKFDTTTITAKAGQVVNVTYVNEGALDHTFLIDGVVAEQKVAPGATLNFSFTAPAAGTYTYYCNVAGHKEAGMTGTLTVNP